MWWKSCNKNRFCSFCLGVDRADWNPRKTWPVYIDTLDQVLWVWTEDWTPNPLTATPKLAIQNLRRRPSTKPNLRNVSSQRLRGWSILVHVGWNVRANKEVARSIWYNSCFFAKIQLWAMLIALDSRYTCQWRCDTDTSGTSRTWQLCCHAFNLLNVLGRHEIISLVYNPWMVWSVYHRHTARARNLYGKQDTNIRGCGEKR